MNKYTKITYLYTLMAIRRRLPLLALIDLIVSGVVWGVAARNDFAYNLLFFLPQVKELFFFYIPYRLGALSFEQSRDLNDSSRISAKHYCLGIMLTGITLSIPTAVWDFGSNLLFPFFIGQNNFYSGNIMPRFGIIRFLFQYKAINPLVEISGTAALTLLFFSAGFLFHLLVKKRGKAIIPIPCLTAAVIIFLILAAFPRAPKDFLYDSHERITLAAWNYDIHAKDNLTKEQAEQLFGHMEIDGVPIQLPMKLSDLPKSIISDDKFEQLKESINVERYPYEPSFGDYRTQDICVVARNFIWAFIFLYKEGASERSDFTLIGYTFSPRCSSKDTLRSFPVNFNLSSEYWADEYRHPYLDKGNAYTYVYSDYRIEIIPFANTSYEDFTALYISVYSVKYPHCMYGYGQL